MVDAHILSCRVFLGFVSPSFSRYSGFTLAIVTPYGPPVTLANMAWEEKLAWEHEPRAPCASLASSSLSGQATSRSFCSLPHAVAYSQVRSRLRAHHTRRRSPGERVGRGRDLDA